MKKFLFVLLATVSLISCEDTQTIEVALQAKVDDRLYTSTDARAALNEDGTLTIQGFNDEESMTIQLSRLGEGNFTIGEGSPNYAVYEDMGGSIYTTNPNGEGVVTISELNEKIKERGEHLKAKNKELNSIMKETEKEEALLVKKSNEFEKLIEEHLIEAYKRIRNSVKNGLAIVPVQRGAAGGSFFAIPPQVQLEIASRNKIIIDEHSGRILVDPELAAEEENKIKKLI